MADLREKVAEIMADAAGWSWPNTTESAPPWSKWSRWYWRTKADAAIAAVRAHDAGTCKDRLQVGRQPLPSPPVREGG